LKLESHKLLSTVALNFNLRRHTLVDISETSEFFAPPQFLHQIELDGTGITGSRSKNCTADDVAGQYRLIPGCPRIDRQWFQRWKRECDEAQALKFALNFGLGH
jgi:hypothetical protein